MYFRFSTVVVLVLLVSTTNCVGCYGFGTFGFNYHHRFSDPVKGILSLDELPEKGTTEYYAVMAHRDRLIHRRGLADGAALDQQLTFGNGNHTLRISSLGFLHYANVSVGTPGVWFLVALDTGSDLFWVPCDCKSCVKSLMTNNGARLDLNIYSPNISSTSSTIPCNSSSCEYQKECSGVISSCPYQIQYLSNGTSSTGILVEDVLHLTTEGSRPKVIDARITFGCGLVETGSFLDGAAPNGLFGLGMDKSSVPSILSAAGTAANSFSMCFGPDGTGRINFGDKGSPNQDETPFNINQLHPTYNISMSQITVETNQSNIGFSAIFDSGTSFTYLNDPAYTSLSESFNSHVQDNRRPSDPAVPFEYCYDISPDATSIVIPNVTLTMKGGGLFPLSDPIIIISDETGVRYCLGVVKSSDVNIIGQNFMTGYNIIFDREKLVLGWTKSNCYDVKHSSTFPVKPRNNSAVPPATAAEPRTLTPEATSESGNDNLSSWTPRLSFELSASILLMSFIPFLAIF